MIEPTREEIDKLKKDVKRLRKRQRTTNLFFLLIVAVTLIIVLTSSASAQVITITNSGGMAMRDINVYSPNQSTGQMDFIGRYNTTSAIITNGSASYTFDLVPINANPLDAPGDWMTGVMQFIQTYITAILIFCAGVGLIYSYGRR